MEKIPDPFKKRREEVAKGKREKFEEKELKKEKIDEELQEVLGDITDEEAELAKEVARKNNERL